MIRKLKTEIHTPTTLERIEAELEHDFLLKLKESGARISMRVENNWNNHARFNTFNWDEKVVLDDLYVDDRWLMSGFSGGERGTLSEPELEPELNDLDNFLYLICPNMPFLAYRVLISSVLERSTEFHGGYYGDSSTYGVKFISLRKLYDKMKEMGLWGKRG